MFLAMQSNCLFKSCETTLSIGIVCSWDVKGKINNDKENNKVDKNFIATPRLFKGGKTPLTLRMFFW
jgi:hypothetical protein